MLMLSQGSTGQTKNQKNGKGKGKTGGGNEINTGETDDKTAKANSNPQDFVSRFGVRPRHSERFTFSLVPKEYWKLHTKPFVPDVEPDLYADRVV